MKSQILLLLIVYIYHITCKTADKCKLYTCGECIGSNDDCVWCAQDDMPANIHRCLPRNSNDTKSTWCDSKLIKSAELHIKHIEEKSFNDTINGVKVQLKPQHIYIKARPGVQVPFTIGFHPAKDYPLDIYYLMDISYTMRESKEDLQRQANNIYKKMTTYTNNVRLGIGSFVEKPKFPYVDKKHHDSHTFKNHLSLTENVTEFVSAIDKFEFGANYDDPEAGLDAIMQAMTCQDEIGWRSGARKIIILCSDSIYHSAGDGKVIGVIKPNDMQCHLSNNIYDETMSLTYDYPSISQINYIASRDKYIIVFAVKKDVVVYYKDLASEILGAKYATLEDGDSAVEIIKSVYLEYADSVAIDFTIPPYIELSLDPDCKNKPTRSCKSTPEQRTVTTNATLEVKYCPPDGKLKHNLEVKVIGLSDLLRIELDVECKCDCETKASTAQGNSAKCNNAGDIQCGICKCNPGSYGVDCGCNGTSTKDIEQCFKDKDDKMWCSSKGECRCGHCECNEGYSGNFCEFNDNSCPSIIKNQMCSGNGFCTLGKCHCNSQWAGDDCSCPLATTTCTAPYSDNLCSGNGICKCGNCECSQIDGKNETYSGQYCDACDDCSEKRCRELEDYVFCNLMNEKKLCDETHKTNMTIVTFLNKTDINGPKWFMAKLCRRQLKNDSYAIFKYQYNENKLELVIQNETELPPKANIYVTVGYAVGTAVLIGIITLIVWKVLITIHDQREYKKFVEETKSIGYDNILYTPPTQNIKNPAFGKK